MILTEEEKELLLRFQNEFEIKANSMALQKVHIEPNGNIYYENLGIYGTTEEIGFYKDGKLVDFISHPVDNLCAILEYAKTWKDNGYVIPER